MSVTTASSAAQNRGWYKRKCEPFRRSALNSTFEKGR